MLEPDHLFKVLTLAEHKQDEGVRGHPARVIGAVGRRWPTDSGPSNRQLIGRPVQATSLICIFKLVSAIIALRRVKIVDSVLDFEAVLFGFLD